MYFIPGRYLSQEEREKKRWDSDNIVDVKLQEIRVVDPAVFGETCFLGHRRNYIHRGLSNMVLGTILAMSGGKVNMLAQQEG